MFFVQPVVLQFTPDFRATLECGCQKVQKFVAPRFSAPEWRGEQKHPRPFGDATSCMMLHDICVVNPAAPRTLQRVVHVF